MEVLETLTYRLPTTVDPDGDSISVYAYSYINGSLPTFGILSGTTLLFIPI